MAGTADSNTVDQDPERPQEKWWKNLRANPIQLRMSAQGKYSPKIDESCLTICNQTARGRTQGNEPSCYSFCIRRVFEHEVRQLTSHFSYDSALHRARRLQAGKEKDRKGVLKYPLPPEGQPSKKKSGLGISLVVVDGDEDMNMEEIENQLRENEAQKKEEEKKNKEVRYWQEGWYLWMTKSRWATQERIDLMMLDLDRQTQWHQAKEQEERTWADQQQQQQQHGESSTSPTMPPEDTQINDSYNNGSFSNIVGHPPYPDPEDSILVRIPTSLPSFDEYSERAQKIFAPTQKVLSILRTSFENGNQKALATHAYELTRDGAPFTLVKNVAKTCFDYFWGPKDDQDR